MMINDLLYSLTLILKIINNINTKNNIFVAFIMLIVIIFHFRKLAVCLSERMLFFNLFSLCDV